MLASCRTDIQSGIDEANDLMYRRQYVAADQLYRKLAKRLEALGDLDEEEEAQRLLVLDRLGKINALYLHDYDDAIGYYQTLVRFAPKSEPAVAARATVADIYHHRLGDLQAAIDAYQKLVIDFPNHPETRRAQLQIANAYFQLRSYEQARTEAELVINRWPKSDEAAQARFQIANSYYVQARFPQAIATYERLLEEKPNPSLVALVLFELGNCFQELNQSERALAYYFACLPDHPDPLMVQRRIQRLRERLIHTRPIAQIELPDYLRERLAASRASGFLSAPEASGVMEQTFTPVRPVLAPAPGTSSSGISSDGHVDQGTASPSAPRTSPKTDTPRTPDSTSAPSPASVRPTAPTPSPAPAPAPTPDSAPELEPELEPEPEPEPAPTPAPGPATTTIP